MQTREKTLEGGLCSQRGSISFPSLPGVDRTEFLSVNLNVEMFMTE